LSWRKQKMIDWLESRNIPVPTKYASFEKMVKVELLNLAGKHKVQTKFCIEQLAEECEKDVKILWLPPAHCELNPIELVWSKVKGYISEHNKGGNVNSILELSRRAITTVTPELWKKCISHARKYEEILWERDRLLDELPHRPTAEPLVISVCDDDTTSDDSDDSDSNSESDEEN